MPYSFHPDNFFYYYYFFVVGTISLFHVFFLSFLFYGNIFSNYFPRTGVLMEVSECISLHIYIWRYISFLYARYEVKHHLILKTFPLGSDILVYLWGTYCSVPYWPLSQNNLEYSLYFLRSWNFVVVSRHESFKLLGRPLNIDDWCSLALGDILSFFFNSWIQFFSSLLGGLLVRYYIS